MTEGKIEYLQMIQEPISRMSTNSAIFKGFAASIVAGISALSYAEINTWILSLSFLPVIAFAMIDVYYLQLERKYRYLYNLVCSEKHDINFLMDLPSNRSDIKIAKARVIDCLSSPSIWLFYPLLIVILVVVISLKLYGGI